MARTLRRGRSLARGTRRLWLGLALALSLVLTSALPSAAFQRQTLWTGVNVGVNADGRLQVYGQFNSVIYSSVQGPPGAGWAWFWLDNSRPMYNVRPSVATNADGRQEVFAVNASDHQVYHAWQLAPNSPPNGGWSGWASLGGSFGLVETAAARNNDGRLEVFAVASNGTMQHAYQTSPGGGWSSFSSMGGDFVQSAPGIGRTPSGRLEVYAIGRNGALYHAWQRSTGGWSGWSSMGGGFAIGSQNRATPAVGINADGRQEVYAQASDGTLRRSWQISTSSGWSAWQNLGAGMSTPVAGRNADGRLEVFAVNGAGRVRHRYQLSPGGTLSPWYPVEPGAGTSTPLTDVRPAVGGNADGRLELFITEMVCSCVHHVWQLSPNGGWSSWSEL